MAENKTKQTTASVDAFLNGIADEQKRKDGFVILEMMKKVSKEEPKMWGASLIGFGFVKITSPSGRTVDWFRLGFSPRKANLSIYLYGNVSKVYADDLKKLGKHKTGSGCLYINKLEDVDLQVLKKMIEASFKREYFDK